MPLLFPKQVQLLSIDEIVASVPKDTSPTKPHYIVFSASPSEATNWESWCGDCRVAEPVLARALPDERSTLVYVGTREQWRAADNIYRATFNVKRVPTMVKVESASEPDMVKTIAEGAVLWEEQLVDPKQMKDVMSLDI